MDIEILRSYRPQHLIPHRITSDVASALTTAADFTYTPDTARFHPKTDPSTEITQPTSNFPGGLKSIGFIQHVPDTTNNDKEGASQLLLLLLLVMLVTHVIIVIVN